MEYVYILSSHVLPVRVVGCHNSNDKHSNMFLFAQYVKKDFCGMHIIVLINSRE